MLCDHQLVLHLLVSDANFIEILADRFFLIANVSRHFIESANESADLVGARAITFDLVIFTLACSFLRSLKIFYGAYDETVKQYAEGNLNQQKDQND